MAELPAQQLWENAFNRRLRLKEDILASVKSQGRDKVERWLDEFAELRGFQLIIASKSKR